MYTLTAVDEARRLWRRREYSANVTSAWRSGGTVCWWSGRGFWEDTGNFWNLKEASRPRLTAMSENESSVHLLREKWFWQKAPWVVAMRISDVDMHFGGDLLSIMPASGDIKGVKLPDRNLRLRGSEPLNVKTCNTNDIRLKLQHRCRILIMKRRFFHSPQNDCVWMRLTCPCCLTYEVLKRRCAYGISE